MKRHYYITGVDGIGKTTQVDRLEQRLAKVAPTHRVWLRFPVLFSFPFLVYARLFGFTRYAVIDGVRVGAWEFHRSSLLTVLFPWVQLIDTIIYSLPKVWWPLLRGKTLLFERYALDILVDLMAATGNFQLHTHLIGQLFLNLIPKGTQIIILDAPIAEIRKRRADLEHDPAIIRRVQAYQKLAHHLNLKVVAAHRSITEVEHQIQEALVVV